MYSWDGSAHRRAFRTSQPILVSHTLFKHRDTAPATAPRPPASSNMRASSANLSHSLRILASSAAAVSMAG